MISNVLLAYTVDAASRVSCCGHAVYDGLALTGFTLSILGGGYYFYLALSRYRVKENKQNGDHKTTDNKQ